MSDMRQTWVARMALVVSLACVGCGEATPGAQSADVPGDASPDVLNDASLDVLNDVGPDRPDAPLDAASDARADASDARTDAFDAGDGSAGDGSAGDGGAGDGGYRVAEALTETARVRGSTGDAVTGTSTSECGANEVAVGVAVEVEGRGYVVTGRVECAALDASGRGFAESAWAGGTPPTSWNSARCPPGQHLIGLIGSAGDILDRLGAMCAPLGWTAGTMGTALGPWGGMLEPMPALCPPGAAVHRLAVTQVSYFGGITASLAEAGCRRVAPR